MERYCERCERVTVDGHLWCQDPECPAEEGYALLGYGDYLGDLKVTKLVGCGARLRCMRPSARAWKCC
jgi:hypothetical protein